jgi:hypothetical protein
MGPGNISIAKYFQKNSIFIVSGCSTKGYTKMHKAGNAQKWCKALALHSSK